MDQRAGERRVDRRRDAGSRERDVHARARLARQRVRDVVDGPALRGVGADLDDLVAFANATRLGRCVRIDRLDADEMRLRVFGDDSNRSVPDELPHLPIRPLISGQVLDSAIQSIGCDLFLTLSMFCFEGIILRHRYSRPVVLLRNHFSLSTRERLCRELVIGRLMHSTDEAYELVEMLLGAGLHQKLF